jgi:hypothetical protein
VFVILSGEDYRVKDSDCYRDFKNSPTICKLWQGPNWQQTGLASSRCFSLYPNMSGYKLKRSSAKKRDFELLSISV